MFVDLLFTCSCRCDFSDTITKISLISFIFQHVPLLLFTLQTQYQNVFSIKISRLPKLSDLVLDSQTSKWYLKGNSTFGPGFIFLPITFVHFCISVLNQCNARQSKKSQITICGMINKSATYNLRLGFKKKHYQHLTQREKNILLLLYLLLKPFLVLPNYFEFILLLLMPHTRQFLWMKKKWPFLMPSVFPRKISDLFPFPFPLWSHSFWIASIAGIDLL